jgi:hypothetical protein
MKTNPPVLSDHKFARLSRWATLWLDWFVWAFYALLPVLAPGRQAARRNLDRAAALVRAMLIIQACRHTPRRYAVRHRYGRAKLRGLVRAAAGARLRRALKGKNDFARLAAIHAMLRNPAAYVAALRVRVCVDGLRRRRSIAPVRSPAPSLPLRALAPCAVDTS